MQGPDDSSAGRGRPAPNRVAPATKAAGAKKAGAPKKSTVKRAAPATQKSATPAVAAAPTSPSPTRKRTSANSLASAPAPVPRGSRPPVPVGTPAAAVPGLDRRAARHGAPTGRRPLAPPGQVPRRLAAPPLADLDRAYIRGLRRAITFLLVLGLCGFLLDGSNRPANPHLVPATDPGAAKGAPAFGSAILTVTSSRHRNACVLEAVTGAQQQAGLMNRTTVAPYAGMAFIFGQPSTEQFWMKDTVIPLSIAWFDAGGRYEKSALMPPCPKTTKVCPTYGPGEPYGSALEVPAGQLKNLGIGAGSTVSFGAACAT